MRPHSYPRLRRCASENGLNVLSSTPARIFLARLAAGAMPFIAAQSCFARKARVNLSWSARSTGRRSTGPSSVSVSPRSAWRPGEILSALRIPASLERPGLAIPGTPAQREEGPLDLPLFPPRPWISRSPGERFTGPFASLRLTHPHLGRCSRRDSTSSIPGVVRALATTAGKKWGLLSCNLAYAKRFR